MSNYQKLPWERVWVTGAGRGIGAALATQLCRAGVDVLASARSATELEALQQSLADAPGKLLIEPLDICQPDQIRSCFQRWQYAGTLPDLAVLNAGTHDPFPVEAFKAQRCQALLNVNLYGTLNCIEPLLEHYLPLKRGHIAVMASVAGYRGLPTAAAYGAGKAALINLCESLYLDLADSGVRIQVINPGFVRTPLTDKNDFAMPALMEPEDAAGAIIQGLMRDRFEISFPGRFVIWLKFLRLLPYNWYFKAIAKITGSTPE
ncbi:SDR family NAD(P)-dependent oxidoreductase [Aliamphritea spongicola]|uniref:SDR family NAD(P)-dependent oxidoreductase n=1 Tax=Aliamphritea spongicola TaxID=707589 RepID=UPI00196AFCD0|nr:SDR family NAD(P)-dependent oxidoreductase [Aliamphritea spongicola]MBN3564357.1 SDR family NAD(P)-dependent oxidoreductase [Aliamphritea spongicola]